MRERNEAIAKQRQQFQIQPSMKAPELAPLPVQQQTAEKQEPKVDDVMQKYMQLVLEQRNAMREKRTNDPPQEVTGVLEQPVQVAVVQ